MGEANLDGRKEPSLDQLKEQLREAKKRLSNEQTEASNHLKRAHKGKPETTCHTCLNKAHAIGTTKYLIERLEQKIREAK